MTSFRIRPRFEVKSTMTAPQIIEELKIRLQQGKDHGQCHAVFIPDHIILKIKKEHQHYWSPQLNLALKEEQDGTLINGLYSPNPHVWTLFTLCYLAIGILFLFIAIIGLSRMSLDMPATILWVLPVLAGIAILLYLSSQVGQKVGAEQTFTLHHFLEDLLDQHIPIH